MAMNETAVKTGLVNKAFYIAETKDNKTAIIGEAGTRQQAEDAIFTRLLETMNVLQNRPNTSATIDVNKDRTGFELRTVTSDSPVHYDDTKVSWSILEGCSYKDELYSVMDVLKEYVEEDFIRTKCEKSTIRKRLEDAGLVFTIDAVKYGLGKFFEEDEEEEKE